MTNPAKGPEHSSQVQAGCLSPDDALLFCDESAPVASELRQHVETCSRCRLLVAEAARAVVDVAATRTRALLTLSEGEQVAGRYRILRFLARGGMGEVYEAFDQVLQENVAVKTLISTALDDDRAVSRLALEVRLARKVTHPNVCRILEFGFHAPASWNGARLPFLTMELLTGETLGKRLARVGPFPLDRVASLAAEMVAGLGAIHAAGIIHRDFKSENAFLARSEGGLERLVLMDFGLARLPVDSDGRMQTTGSLIAGTADYIAPEQLQGAAVTPAADIYALGVVLFELLTGKRPFTGDSPVATAMNRLRLPPPAPSSLRPGLPRAWDEVVLGCLQRHPSRRFSRVEDVLAPLGPAAPPARFSRPAWRQPRRLAAALALPLAAVLATALVLLGRTRNDAGPAGSPPASTSAAPSELPPLVPIVPKPVLLGRKWPTREIRVCLQGAGKIHDPEARRFEAFAQLDFSLNEVGDFWFEYAGPCPADPRGMVALTLAEGNEARADAGYHSDRPARVHLGTDSVGYYDRTVHAFGRILGFGLQGYRELSAEEIRLVQEHYGRKPPGSVLGPWGRCMARAPGKKYALLERCTGNTDTSWRRLGPDRQLRSSAGDGACLSVAEKRAPRQPLAVAACRGDARDALSLAGASWRAFGDRCVGAYSARPGSTLGVGDCNGSPTQRWDFFEGDDRIRLSGSNLCVTAPRNAIELGAGTRITLERCGKGPGIQQFVLDPGGGLKIEPGTDLCLTASFNSVRAGDITLESWCDRKENLGPLRFHLVGTLKVGGGCLTVQGLHNDGTPIWSVPCVGGMRHQVWEYFW